MLLRLSAYNWICADGISSCELFQKEDNCWYVKWTTEDGEILSDAFTGKVAATNYIKEINDEIIKYESEDDE